MTLKSAIFSKALYTQVRVQMTIGKINHNGVGSTGEAHKVSWELHGNGAKLTDDCFWANHVMGVGDKNRHGFPDMSTTVVPQVVTIGDQIEYWDEDSRTLKKAYVDGWQWSAAKAFGNRIIWGKLPAFKGLGNLVSGTPIFKNEKVVSVVTTSDGNGNYAISGVSSNSGHAIAEQVRIRTGKQWESCYGGMLAPSSVIKEEAVRRKKVSSDPTVYIEVVQFSTSTRIIGWRGDNEEIFHTRYEA